MAADGPRPARAQIRPAVADDVPGVEAVVAEAFTPYIARIGVPPMPMRADYAGLVAAGHAWVAEDGSATTPTTAVVGVLVLETHRDHLLLDVLAVADRVRGQGVGAQLMAFAEDRARTVGLREIRLYTNQLMWENLAYYPRHGYVEVGRETVEEVFHRVSFVKRLDDGPPTS